MRVNSESGVKQVLVRLHGL